MNYFILLYCIHAFIYLFIYFKKTREEAIAAQIDLLRIKFPRQRFPGLLDIVSISCKTGEGISELRTLISQAVKKKGFMTEVAQSWVKLHDFIGTASIDSETTSRSVLEDWARMCGVKEDQITTACRFLRDMGSLLYFEGVGLENLVILNPKWLTSMMSSLITFQHSWVKAGTLPLQDVPQVFKSYPTEMHETLLSLLEQFSIIFRIHSQDGKREILVPSLLPEDCRSSILAKEWKQRQKRETDEFGRIYRFPFLPLGFFGRIMVRVLHLPGIQGNLFWRYGMVIEYNDPRISPSNKIQNTPRISGKTSPLTNQQSSIPSFSRSNSTFDHSSAGSSSTKQIALLEYDPVQFRFSIRVRIPKIEFGKNMLLQTLVDCVDTILEEYCMRECAERLIPCTHCMDLDHSSSSTFFDQKGTGPFLFSFAECVISITDQGGHVFCNHIRSPSRMVAVDRLAPDIALSGIPLIDEKQLKICEILGRGGFGTVYKAEFQPLTSIGRYQPPQRKTRRTRINKQQQQQQQNSTKQEQILSEIGSGNDQLSTSVPSTSKTTIVAVKELHIEDKQEFPIMYSDFQSEVYVMSQMRHHPNIVRLHGVCMLPKPRMVLELLPFGDLHGFLHPKDPHEPENIQTFIQPSKFPWKLRLLMALDIAKGMFVLHSQSPPIIHRDLRSPNIFLSSLDENSSVRAKVADFGLARIVAPTVSGTLNTWQWLAPEVLGVSDSSSTSTSSYGISSDVYSFGIICWEIATGGFPFDEFNDDPRFSTSNSNEISITALKNSIAKENLRPTLLKATSNSNEIPIEGSNIPIGFHSLIQQCWQTNPNDRPTFFEILDQLIDICTLNTKQKHAVTTLTKSQNNINSSTKHFNQERASCRLTIDFQPLQITNLFQQTANKIQYHTEYKLDKKYSNISSIVPMCIHFIENQFIWVGSMSGQLQVWNIDPPSSSSSALVKIENQILFTYDRPLISFASIVDQCKIWLCFLDGKMMTWDFKNNIVIREWNLRKNTIITMLSIKTSTDKLQIWVASPHCIHVYYDVSFFAFFFKILLFYYSLIIINTFNERRKNLLLLYIFNFSTYKGFF